MCRVLIVIYERLKESEAKLSSRSELEKPYYRKDGHYMRLTMSLYW